jgi:predicted amidohydrolase
MNLPVALAQIRCVPGDVAGNVATMTERIARAAREGAMLIAFPELSDTGYDMAAILDRASSWEGPSSPLAALSASARTHRIAVVAGLSERVGGDVFNGVAVLGPDGRLLARGRKTHLMNLDPVRESRHLRAGDGLAIFDYGGFRFGIVVCYEIRFPEIARALALAGAEVILVPAAFPQARRSHWDVLTEARAIENQAYVLAVNRVGTDAGIALGGGSRVVDPWGLVVAGAAGEEALLSAILDRAVLERVRSGLRVLDDRREAVYRNVGSGIGEGMSSGKPR